MNTTFRVMVAGFVGGFMTPLLGPLQELLRTHQYPAYFGLWFWVLGAGLGLLGCIIVWLLKESDVLKALILGLSLPACLANLATSSTKPNVNVQNPDAAKTSINVDAKGTIGAIPFFISDAYAAQPPPTPSESRPAVDCSVEINIEGPPFGYEVEFLDAQAKVLDRFEVSAADSLMAARAVPDKTTQVRFKAGDQSLAKALVCLPRKTIEIQLRGSNFFRKFEAAQVLGKPADLVPGTLAVTLIPRDKAPLQAQGWIFVGKLQNGKWTGLHTVEGDSQPTVGEKRAIYSVYLREGVGTKCAAHGIVSALQRVRFLELDDSSGTTWARVQFQA
jgi:hypothetical protein